MQQKLIFLIKLILYTMDNYDYFINKHITLKCRCGGKYIYYNRKKHKQTKKHQEWINEILNFNLD